MAEAVPAWLIDWPACPLALAPSEVVEIVHEPEIYVLPFGPSWCSAVMYWRGRLLPLALPRGCPTDVKAVVVAFAPEAGKVEYAGIAGRDYPRRIEVAENADCLPPQGLPLDVQRILAAFVHEDRTVVVPDLSAMFGRAADV